MRKKIEAFLKKHDFLRILSRRIYIWLSQCRYKRTAKKIAVSQHIILFETFMGRQYGCNPRAIYEYMLTDRRFDSYIFVWAFENIDKKNAFPQLQRAEVVKYKSEEYYRYCAAAGVIVTNSNLDYGIIKREGQTFIQTWHGTPLKRLRCDIEAEHGNANNTKREIKLKNGIDMKRYDYLISPSGFAADRFISAFDLARLDKQDIVINMGYPRNDILLNHTEGTIAQIRERTGIDGTKKVVLYAPTFRDHRHEAGKGYVYDLGIDFDLLYQELSSDVVILFRTHYFVANRFDFKKYDGFIVDISDLEDITEIYLISDILVTDYSSALFDYAILKRPMVFYMYDLEEYENRIRGFYLDLEELPGSVVRTEEQLIDAIRRNDFSHSKEYAVFNKKYNSLDDGNASKRVADLLCEASEKN